MASKSDTIRVTPLTGGRTEDGVCALLEIGGARILLDCGCTTETSDAQLREIASVLREAGGVHAVLLSHADIHHLGALPVLLGREGLGDVPIICTTPVLKFGQIVLYDHALNRAMEGRQEAGAYDLDDVDAAFSNPIIVKFNQTVNVPEIGSLRAGPPVTVCALRSGRTLGGSIWKIRYGPTEILYTMDINLKKEVVLDGLNIELLPSAPALMIVEGGCVSRAEGRGRRKDKDEGAFIAAVMETLRGGGSVLIPCETAGRSLELLQMLGKYWYDNKLGLYHLVFLSHMARNVPEFARMQLEWMSDSLIRNFYNGKPNPFDLPQVRFASSMREVDRHCPGPKVILATDACLSSGLSKEALLRLGGDPRCRVLFFDSSDACSLSADLRAKYATPPVIATLSRPERVELVGVELAQHRLEQERARRAREEQLQRKRRQEELSMFNVEGDLVDDEDDAQMETRTLDANGLPQGAPSTPRTPRTPADGSKKSRVDNVRKFLEPNFLMFESREPALTVDEYGASIDDLNFKDITTIEARWLTKDKFAPDAPVGKMSLIESPGKPAPEEEDEEEGVEDMAPPTKLVATQLRVQFTCDFKEINASGRADFKAIKTLVKKVTPARLLVLRGRETDCNALLQFAKQQSIEAFAPSDRTTVSFEVRSEKLRVQVPQSLLPHSLRPVHVFSSSSSALEESKCSVAALAGTVQESRTLAQEGTRLVKYTGSGAEAGAPLPEMEVEGEGEAEAGAGEVGGALRDQSVDLVDTSIGVVSVGEVTLNSLRQLIEAAGVQVEYRIDAQGAVLVCGDQVIIRKENTSDFVIEGPPVPAFYEARKALYQQFAFV
ncbi:beta-lactamase-like protein [Ochromonadaceae sp. CCMP2298]|nr:beta-lactamase-like protein [Ochromonadaceae sp. CCMP2298]